MLCPKCGAEVIEGIHQCSQCGEKLVPDSATVMAAPELKDESAILGLPVMALLGAAALIIGPFFRWVFQSNDFQTVTMQGLYWSPGTALCVLGAMVFVMTFVLKEKEQQLSVVLTVLGALCLALVGHFAYVVCDEPGLARGDLREGFYIAAAGGFFTFLAGCPLFRRLKI